MPKSASPLEVPREARRLQDHSSFFQEACMANKKGNDEEFRPTGTMAVLVIFVITLIAIWATIYMILVGRGGTL
jgi:hypothetical protein